jgi:hypothetical protein
MPGTRARLLADIASWAEAPGALCVFWLLGFKTGTGKSTIAHTVCEHFAKKNLLGASFFLSRQVAERHHLSNLARTVADQLAKQQRAFTYVYFRADLEAHDTDVQVLHQTLDLLWRKVLEHLRELKIRATDRFAELLSSTTMPELPDLTLERICGSFSEVPLSLNPVDILFVWLYHPGVQDVILNSDRYTNERLGLDEACHHGLRGLHTSNAHLKTDGRDLRDLNLPRRDGDIEVRLKRHNSETHTVTSIFVTTRVREAVAGITKVYTNPNYCRMDRVEHLICQVCMRLVYEEELVALYVAYGYPPTHKVLRRVRFRPDFERSILVHWPKAFDGIM